MTRDEWKDRLTPERYAVLQEGMTEAPFSGAYVNHHEDGMYTCAGCGASLFSSYAKFDSGSGWPSFTDVVEKEQVRLEPDDSHGMHRTEVVCANCGGHLGHVFDDPPSPRGYGRAGDPRETGGKRFCINSRALDFEQNKNL